MTLQEAIRIYVQSNDGFLRRRSWDSKTLPLYFLPGGALVGMDRLPAALDVNDFLADDWEIVGQLG